MSVEFYLARRYLSDRQHGNWGWLISTIAIGSVALGVAALIVTLAVMTGFREDIQSKMLGINPHIVVSSFQGRMPAENPTLQNQLEDHKEVQAWSPYVSGQILIGRGKHSTGASLKGVNIQRERVVSNLPDKLVAGLWDSIETSDPPAGKKPKIILGTELARSIGARMGDRIWVITPSSIELPAISLPQAHLFDVVGIVQSGLYDYDSVLAYTDLKSAQKLFGLENQITGLGLRVSQAGEADRVSQNLRNLIEGPYWIRSWVAQNKNLFSALKLERTVMFILLTMLTVVAAFMIVSNLLLMITQKVKEIGILRAIGATGSTIQKTFLYQGLIMGFLGNILGVVLGIGLSLFLAKTDIIKLPADVYYIDHLPIKLVPLDVLSVVVLAALIVLIASIYPARRAAKLDPIEAIRYG